MTTYRYLITGCGKSDLPLRVLNLFVQRDLPLERVELVRRNGCYDVLVEQGSLSFDKATLILEKMRMIVSVSGAEMQVVVPISEAPCNT